MAGKRDKEPKPKAASGQRTFVPISAAELEDKISAALEAAEEDDRGITRLNRKVEEDLRKVEFDTENLYYQADSSDAEPLIGYHTLENGLSFLGVSAGGDWESPIFFIIYWDGKSLRGYIPTDGNSWNRITNRAYGNDNEEDLADLKKRFPDQTWSEKELEYFSGAENAPEIYPEAIKQDIMARFKRKDA